MRQITQQMTISGNSPHTLTFPEGPAQTFEVGAPLVLNASKQVIEATSPVASLVGVAAVNASGITGNKTPTWVANDDTLFGVACPGIAQANIGTLINVKKVGALWQADLTAGVFMVMETGLDIPGNTAYARGKFLESATQLAKAA